MQQSLNTRCPKQPFKSTKSLFPLLNTGLTRWLYCVECPQYSTRLEVLGCLCDCVSGRVQQVVRVIRSKAHRGRRLMVQCYSTGASNVSLHEGTLAPPAWQIRLNLCILQPTVVHNRNGKWIGSAVLYSLRHKMPILYNGLPYPPEVPFPTGDLHLPCNTRCFGPMRAHNRNGTSIGSAVFAQMTAECPYMVCLFRPQNCSFPCWHLDSM